MTGYLFLGEFQEHEGFASGSTSVWTSLTTPAHSSGDKAHEQLDFSPLVHASVTSYTDLLSLLLLPDC